MTGFPAALAREVVPAADGLPGADDPAVLRRIDEVLAAVPALGEAVSAALADGVPALAALAPAARSAVVEAVVAGWGSSPPVRAALGALPRAPIDIGPDDLSALLAPVRARGRRWKEAP